MISKNLLKENISIAVEEEKQKKPPRTVTKIYRDQKQQFYLIDMDPGVLFLDHLNARIGAQLKDRPESEQFTKNPESQSSQDFFAQLIRDSEGYGKLKKQLEDLGQFEPGIMSVDGRLIQGNTRAVALRELGRHMTVAVLPLSATEQDFLTISMTEQMMVKVVNPFTFTNRLLRVADHINAFNNNRDKLIKDMGWSTGKKGLKQIYQHQGCLNLINSFRDKAKPHLIPYSFFDAREEHFKNLYDDYESMRNSGDFEEAEQMKYNRFVGMLLNIPKDQMRIMDEDLFDAEFFKNQEFQPILASCKPDNIQEGLNIVLGPVNQRTIDSSKVFAQVLSLNPPTQQEGGPSPDLTEHLAILKSGIDTITDDKVREKSRAGIRKFPVKELDDIRKKVEQVRNILPEAMEDKAFDMGKFKYELTKLGKEIEQLEKDIKKIGSDT